MLLKQLQTDTNASAILFVPGAFTGAWIWQDTFAPYFFDRGYHTYAMTFVGHGRPRWRKAFTSLKQYVTQLAETIDRISTTHQQAPILIAHSLGGLVTLKYLAEYKTGHAIPAATLLSPIPHDGVSASALGLFKKSPISAVKFASLVAQPAVRHLSKPPLGIYSTNTNQTAERAITKQLNAESPWALLQSLGRTQVDVSHIKTPCHFIAATGDYIIRPEDVQRTAKAMQAPIKIFDGMSHTFQAEADWETVAAYINRTCLPTPDLSPN